MDQDPQVKKEADETMTKIGSPEQLSGMHLQLQVQQPLPRSADEDGHLALVPLPQPSPPRKPKVSLSTVFLFILLSLHELLSTCLFWFHGKLWEV